MHIYQGTLKNFCVPGLNCYSCPLSLGACPIGAMQAVSASRNFHLAFYVWGVLVMIGGVAGRVVCGFLCPFGLFQDLLFRIPFIKKIHSFRIDKYLRKLKYLVLAVFVILLPMFVVDFMGQGAPFFCKFICPVGTLEGGILLVLFNRVLRKTVGFLYAYKVGILCITMFFSIVIFRPFCKYICPLGAIYGLFNPISLYRYKVDENNCIHCGKCAEVCEMQLDPIKNINSAECIRCAKCKDSCPVGAIHTQFLGRKCKGRKEV